MAARTPASRSSNSAIRFRRRVERRNRIAELLERDAGVRAAIQLRVRVLLLLEVQLSRRILMGITAREQSFAVQLSIAEEVEIIGCVQVTRVALDRADHGIPELRRARERAQVEVVDVDRRLEE